MFSRAKIKLFLVAYAQASTRSRDFENRLVWEQPFGFRVTQQITRMLEFGCSEKKKKDKKPQNLHPDSYATDQKANKF